MVDHIKYYPDLAEDWVMAQSYVLKNKFYAKDRVKDSLSRYELENKLWILNELKKLNILFQNVAIIGGWYCHHLCSILFDELKVDLIYNYDIDKDSKYIGNQFNKRYKTKYISCTKDLFMENFRQNQIDYSGIDLVINPYAEHMYDMRKIYHKKYFRTTETDTIFCIQSTNYTKQHEDTINDHINTVDNENELCNQIRLKQVLYKGSKNYKDNTKMFMVIGK